MSLLGAKKLHVCSCNATMPLDGDALARALGLDAPLPVARSLCQRNLAEFTDSVTGEAIVACTQEARLLRGVAEESGRVESVRFVNIRETGGWSAQAPAATPKMAASSWVRWKPPCAGHAT
jgi:hypothetical protein